MSALSYDGGGGGVGTKPQGMRVFREPKRNPFSFKKALAFLEFPRKSTFTFLTSRVQKKEKEEREGEGEEEGKGRRGRRGEGEKEEKKGEGRRRKRKQANLNLEKVHLFLRWVPFLHYACAYQ